MTGYSGTGSRKGRTPLRPGLTATALLLDSTLLRSRIKIRTKIKIKIKIKSGHSKTEMLPRSAPGPESGCETAGVHHNFILC
jgi:hypothetical protein